MAIPRKINFLQLGRYGRRGEQCYRQTFGSDWSIHLFTGLRDCQARGEKRFDFAFNASFAAVNVVKTLRKMRQMDFTIGQIKSLMINAYMLQRFFAFSVLTRTRH